MFSSLNPATGEQIWQGREATQQEVEDAVVSAKGGSLLWSRIPFEERVAYLHQFEENLRKERPALATTISQESGKPFWESDQEVESMLGKIATSIEAYLERSPQKEIPTETHKLFVQHKPHGVVAVFGPFNFPGHLPNGHIIPALLAGNSVIFKGSELTPRVSAQMITLWEGLPKGVIHLVQGGAETGQHLSMHPGIDGLFFTGSYRTGQALLQALPPEKILALEMGGNNPLVVSEVTDLKAAAYLTIQSAFLTSGQRCTCARRLIVPSGKKGDAFLEHLISMTESIRVGPYTQSPEPFMGPVISLQSAEKLLKAQETLRARGGMCLVEMRPNPENTRLLRPGIIDVTANVEREDEELFGPLLQLIRVPTFDAAIQEANNTAYGLCASLFSSSKAEFQHFYREVKAGVINWNTSTTGASGKAPFGGIGKSGNHRPSGYYAADYCAYPVTSLENEKIAIPKERTPGIEL